MSENYFWYLFGGVVVSAIISVAVYLIKKRHYPNATDTDQLFWKMEIATWYVGAVVFFYGFTLPFTPYQSHIDPSDTQEQKIERLIENEKENLKFFETYRSQTFVIFWVLGTYLLTIAGFYTNFQKKRNLELLRENPETKKPLGL